MKIDDITIYCQTQGNNYLGKVILNYVQIRLVASNESLMGCGPLPDWLSYKDCIYAIKTFDDNVSRHVLKFIKDMSTSKKIKCAKETIKQC